VLDEHVAQAVRLPKSLPKLPSPRARDSRYFISRSNVEDFREYLLAPIVTWMKAGLFAVRAFSHVDYEWIMPPQWERESRANVDRYLLLDDFSLSMADGAERSSLGLPFGHFEEIDAEVDPQKKAYKILWSVEYAQSISKDILYEGEFIWFGAQEVIRRATGTLYRSYEFPPKSTGEAGEVQNPAKAGEAAAPSADVTLVVNGQNEDTSAMKSLEYTGFGDRTDYLYREVLQLADPPVVQGYAQIFWRHRGAFEDDGWMHSPVIGRNRRVLGANRSDPLLGGELTTDDLFVWSGSPAEVYAQLVDEKVLFVPFPALANHALELLPYAGASSASSFLEESGLPRASVESKTQVERVLSVRGYHQRTDGTPTMTLFNGETRTLPGIAPWVPVTMVMVPRRVWILELSPRDPAYLAGRQVLVIDKLSMLPVYKVVYGRSGEFERMVFGAWSLANSKDEAIKFPLASFVFGVDRNAKQAMAFSSDYVRTFLGAESKAAAELRSLLSIESHGEKAENTEKKDQAEKETTAQEGNGAQHNAPRPSVSQRTSPETTTEEVVED
jgi:hypothetical protein